MEELKLKKIQVRNNVVITTATKYFKEEDREKYFSDLKEQHKIFTTAESKNLPILTQKVVNVGPTVRDIKEGDYVRINPLFYLSRKLIEQKNSIQQDVADYTGVTLKEAYSELDYNFPKIVIDDEEYLILFDRDIDYIIVDGTLNGVDIHSERS